LRDTVVETDADVATVFKTTQFQTSALEAIRLNDPNLYVRLDGNLLGINSAYSLVNNMEYYGETGPNSAISIQVYSDNSIETERVSDDNTVSQESILRQIDRASQVHQHAIAQLEEYSQSTRARSILYYQSYSPYPDAEFTDLDSMDLPADS
jgi:hypothetical protein